MSALFATVLAAALAGRVEALDRSEVRHRTLQDQGSRIDVETMPGARLTVFGRRFSVTGSYGGRFTVRDVAHGTSRRELLHGGGLHLDTWDRTSRLALFGDARYGTMNFGDLRVDPATVAVSGSTPGPEPMRFDQMPLTSFSFVGARAGFVAAVEPSSRTRYLAWIHYVASGGADDASRQRFPLIQGPQGELSLLRGVVRRLHLGGAFGASRVWFSSGPEATTLEQLALGEIRVAEPTTLRIGAGIAETWSRNDDHEARALRSWPLVRGELVHQPVARLELRAQFRVGPYTDRISGELSERANLGLYALYGLSRFFALRGIGGAMQSIPMSGRAAVRVLFGEAALVARIGAHLRLEGGTRSAFQEAATLETPVTTWVFFLAARVTTTALPL